MKGVPGSVSSISWYSLTKAEPTIEARWPSAGLPRLQARFIWLWDEYKVWTDSAYFKPSWLAELRTLEMSRSTPVEDRREETLSAEEDSVIPIRTLEKHMNEGPQRGCWLWSHGFWFYSVLDSRTSNLLVWSAALSWTIALMSAQRDGTMSATRSTPASWTPSTPSFSQKTRADWGDKTNVKTSENHLTVKTWQTLRTRHC